MSRPHQQYVGLQEDQRQYLVIGAFLVFQGLFLMLFWAHRVVFAAGLASLLASIYFFHVSRDAGKRRKSMLLQGSADRPLPTKARYRLGVDARNGFGLLILVWTINLLFMMTLASMFILYLVATFGHSEQ